MVALQPRSIDDSASDMIESSRERSYPSTLHQGISYFRAVTRRITFIFEETQKYNEDSNWLASSCVEPVYPRATFSKLYTRPYLILFKLPYYTSHDTMMTSKI
jgi:hypothetical protein